MPERETFRIFAVLGRELLGWGTTPPGLSQFAIFYRPAGSGYVEQCDWERLGVTPLPPGRPDPDDMRFFTEPEYGDEGLKATVLFVTRRAVREPDGRRRPPFISQEQLTLAKTAERWTIVDRRVDAIT